MFIKYNNGGNVYLFVLLNQIEVIILCREVTTCSNVSDVTLYWKQRDI